MTKIFQYFCFVLSCPCLIFGIFTDNLPQPYNEVNLLPYNAQGWFLNGSELESIIKTNHPKTVIEVGCWIGLSTRFIASLLPDEGKLYAIDHWLGSVENQPGEWAYVPVLPVLYEQFLSNVIHAGLTEKIIPIRMDSLKAAEYLHSLKEPIIPDLIYLDASHDTESVYADLNAWYPFVQGHGNICGDDWIWNSVQLAVKNFAKKHKLKIEASGNFWCLHE
jgi:hypothetical protein